MSKRTHEEIGTDIGQVVDEKRALYGDSIRSSEAAIALLWPTGVPPRQYGLVLLFARSWDKWQRLVTDAPGDHESQWRDLAGYALRGAGMEEQRSEERMKQECSGNASDRDAANSSNATPGSAAPNTRQPTTGTRSERPAPAPSPQPESSSANPAAAHASTATADASLEEAVLQRPSDSKCYERMIEESAL